MIPRAQVLKLRVLGVLLLVGFAGLGFRLFDLQVRRSQELKLKAERNTQISYAQEPIRGEIRDIHGVPLARSRLVKRVCADPSLITNEKVGNRQALVARTLAPLLGLPEPDLAAKLQPRVLGTNSHGENIYDKYVLLKHYVEPEQWEKIRATMQALPLEAEIQRLPRLQRTYYYALRRIAVFAEDEQLREYPNETLAAQVLGFAGLTSNPSNQVEAVQTVGKDGLELVLQNTLCGSPGRFASERNRKGEELAAYRTFDLRAQPGYNAVLTLDAQLQRIVEAALRNAMTEYNPVSASGLIVRPRTGEILAMASLPSYDPNRPGESRLEHRRNRLITDIAEPGSTFKIVPIAAALDKNAVNLETRYDCGMGSYFFAGRILRDHERYGLLSVEQILAKSSNIGTAKIAIDLKAEPFFAYIRAFGFGRRTGIELPGEEIGLVRHVTNWWKISISRIPIGQGISVTPLQMTMAMCALANEGQLMRPYIVHHIEDAQGRIIMSTAPLRTQTVVSPATARDMVRALKSVVSTNGTGTKARLTYYHAAGKTGTAEKPGEGGYQRDKYFASFIGFFPADRPELCIGVFLDEPRKRDYYGGQTAGPIFRQIGEKAAPYLSLPPDFLPEPKGVAQRSAERRAVAAAD